MSFLTWSVNGFSAMERFVYVSGASNIEKTHVVSGELGFGILYI